MNTLKFLLRLLGFWFGMFFFFRVFFYGVIHNYLGATSLDLMAASFVHAIRLDISTAAYLTIIPALLFWIANQYQLPLLRKTGDLFTIVLIVIYCMIGVGECGLYLEWKAKLNMQALSHFSNPTEVFKTASFFLIAFFFIASGVLSAAASVLYWRFIRQTGEVRSDEKPLWQKGLATVAGMIVIGGFWAVGMRGGFGQIPIQSSDSYFSSNQIVNDAAVNPFWNIAFEFISWSSHGNENPYVRLAPEVAKRTVQQMFSVKKDTTVQFLSVKKPNIVFIILESWSALCVKSFGGDNFAPFADSLSREGIRFSQFYPAGYVSDQGIPAILSGYPASSRIAVINQTSKATSIPCINQDLKKLGYSSGFLFGGDLNYGNIKSYLFAQNWQTIVEEKDLPDTMEHGALGIHDKDMAQEYIRQLNKAKAPFVYSWFTVSTHIPYDFKGEKKKLVELENDYVNAMAYSDEALKLFFQEAKKQSWYDSTLFVICADHSHGAHIDYNSCTPMYHKIPMFFFGNVIQKGFRGKEISQTFSQTDIAPTLLRQLGLTKEADQYRWGKNMFNPYTLPFAFYCSFSNSGIVFNEGYVVYQYQTDKIATKRPRKEAKITDSMTVLLKAIQQEVFEDYRNR